MFTLDVFNRILTEPLFIDDYATVRRGLAQERVGQARLFDEGLDSRLAYFVESVLASAPQWDQVPRANDICRIAAEVAELLSVRGKPEGTAARKFRIRAALLYELADYPAIASAVLHEADYSAPLQNLLSRQGAFRQLFPAREWTGLTVGEPSIQSFAESTLYSDVRSVMRYQQGITDSFTRKASDLLVSISKDFSIGCSASEIGAWEAVLSRHAAAAVRRYVPTELVDSLREMRFPSELWSSQTAAIQGGLLDVDFDTWGLAAPTGTGKTFITRLLIATTLQHDAESVVLYLVPSRALVHEVSSSLAAALKPLAYEVSAVTPQLIALDTEEADALAASSVLVLTPEKADLLLRLGNDIFSRVSLIIIDEAHHIESSTRGVLLEMYLWRLRRRLQGQARFVFLSAVAPNIRDVVSWVGSHPGSVVIEQRATRMRVGVYKVLGTGKKASGTIEYSDGTVLPLVKAGAETSKGQGIVQLAALVVRSGPVLVVAKGKRECERLAKLMYDWVSTNSLEHSLSDDDAQGETVQRLDSCLEREMYPEVTLRTLVSHRIAYHHAGLPPSVRNSLEDDIRKGLVDFVFATTTLAEGVNFPFSTVIVQSLALREPPEKGRPARYHPVTPRVFWNIAGRAGRPGHDREGQVILFEPSLGLEKINYVLGHYLDARLSSISPVRSALADSIAEIESAIVKDELSLDDLKEVKLPTRASKRVQGAINLLRVSLLHARASQFAQSPEEIYESTFAAKCLDASQQGLARQLFEIQDNVVLEFLTTPQAPPPELIAELGLSIETLTDLREWVRSLQNWQIDSMGHVMRGGNANLDQVKYIVGPVAKLMAELEGPKLGGFLSEIIVLWVSGVPFRSIWGKKEGYWQTPRIEDLISVVYSRVQFLLPWGLYATDRLLEAEAKRRGLRYDNQLRLLAYLADAGVPTFDALRLVSLQFERADATRLAARYQQAGGLKTGQDIVQWLISQPLKELIECVRGTDQRRVDFDLERRIQDLRAKR